MNTNTALQRLYIRPTPSYLTMVHENNKNALWCCYLPKVAYLCNIISNSDMKEAVREWL